MGEIFFRGADSRAVSTQVSRRFQGLFDFVVSGVVSRGGFIGSCAKTGFRGGFRCGFSPVARPVSGVVSHVASDVVLAVVSDVFWFQSGFKAVSWPCGPVS